MEETVTNAEPVKEISFDIILKEEAINKLKSIAKWSNVLAIVNFTISAIGILFSFFSGKVLEQVMYLIGQQMPPMSPGAYFFNVIFNLIIVALVQLPVFFLYKFSKKAQKALLENDENLLTEALTCQDKYFKIMAWYTIIGAALLAIFFVGLILILFMVS